MTSEAQAKRTIPAGIKREVRQRCGFGCVVCGLPLYEYEHMLGWAQVQRHEAHEITLLCDSHHREKTAGLLPLAAVEAANADPFNLRMGASAPFDLHYSGDECSLSVGSNDISATSAQSMTAIMVDGTALLWFGFEDGHYLLNCLLFGETNEPLLQVVDNELVYSIEPWDIEWVGKRLTIRAAARKIFIELQFEPPNRIVIQRGRILHNGVELFVTPDFILVMNNTTIFSGCTIHNCIVALNLGVDVRGLPSGVRIAGIPRYGVNRDAALAWARETVGLDYDTAGVAAEPAEP